MAMRSNQDVIGFQENYHSLQPTSDFTTVEEFCLYLMHLKAYEEAMTRAGGMVVLDYGCNIGYGCKVLSSVTQRTVGVDVSGKAVEIARNRYGSEGVEFKVVDGVSLPFDDATFDLVVSFQVIEHIGDYEPYLSEIKRVLTRPGCAIFTTPNAVVRLEPGMKPWNQFHVTEFTADELRELLRGYFSDVTIQGIFGEQDIHSVLLNGFLRAKRAHSRWWGIRSKTRALLPFWLLEKLRGAKRFVQQSKLQQDELERYSSSQFFYSDENLEQTLDLMAVCLIT